MPGEVKHIEVRCPPGGAQCVSAALRGWDVEPRRVTIQQVP
jgi:hypothetical protein